MAYAYTSRLHVSFFSLHVSSINQHGWTKNRLTDVIQPCYNNSVQNVILGMTAVDEDGICVVVVGEKDTGNMKGRITVIQMPSRHDMRGTGYTGMACYSTDLYSMKTRTQRGITKE